jgi:hypothetical protein
MLEDGRYCPVRMICGSTAAGDLVWKCHLLTNRDGAPYVQHGGQRHYVKTKGTRIVCQLKSLDYDQKYLIDCFGADDAIWPVPFLPEFFLDRPIAKKFSPEHGVVEVVKIHEDEPVFVFAKDLVPWYRPLEIDRSRALTFDEGEPDYQEEEFFDDVDTEPSKPKSKPKKSKKPEFDITSLVEGWDEISDNETFDLEDLEHRFDEDGFDEDGFDELESFNETLVPFINVITSFSDIEQEEFNSYEKILASSDIKSKKEAEELRRDPTQQERAEQWLSAALNRLQVLSNYDQKIGAVISLVERHKDQQLLIIQPRQKWAAKMVDVLKQRGLKAYLFDPKNKSQLSRYLEGEIQILVTPAPKEELFIEDILIISVSAYDLISWLDILNPTQMVYTIANAQLGYSDFNLVPEHSHLNIEKEDYEGPGFNLLDKKLKTQVEKRPKSTTDKSITTQTVKEPKKKKTPKPKYKIKSGKGRPKTATSYEKALEVAKKLEAKGQVCEIFSPDNDKDALYKTGMPVELQGDLT